MYTSKYFKIQELVPKSVYDQRGELQWELLDPTTLMVLDNIREEFGPTVCNDWVWGGRFQQRGLRTDPNVGAQYSQHRYGRAFDIHFEQISVDVARESIISFIEMGDERFTPIKGIGIHSSFLHFDTRNTKTLKTFTYS